MSGLAETVYIELSYEDAKEWSAGEFPYDGFSAESRLAAACRDGLENERVFAESEAAKLPPATAPELGFTHVAECRRCRQPITIARWSHISTGGFPSGNEANADHNPMPDPTTVKEWDEI